MSIESVMPYNHLILYRPLLPLTLIFPSFRDFSNELVLCTKRPKYWSFSFSIRPSNEYSELISFRMDWLGLLAMQGALKSFFQYHSAKASILWPPDAKNWLIGKDADAGKDWRWEEKRMTQDEVFGWHHRLDGDESEQALGVCEGLEAWCAAVHGSPRVGHDWATELNSI